jgi:hypothetical protein
MSSDAKRTNCNSDHAQEIMATLRTFHALPNEVVSQYVGFSPNIFRRRQVSIQTINSPKPSPCNQSTTALSEPNRKSRFLQAMLGCIWMLPLFAGTSATSANLITNGSFETVSPALPVNGICTTDTSVYPYSACSAPGWTGNYQIGNGATIGIGGSSFGIPQPDPDGKNALILQSSGSQVFTSAAQSFDIPTDGVYTLTFYAANRSNILTGPQTVTVTLDGSTLAGGTLTSLPAAWKLETLTFAGTAGNHTLTFSGLDPSPSDISVFIDDVSVDTASPEPSAFLMMGLGLLALFKAIWNRKKVSC